MCFQVQELQPLTVTFFQYPSVVTWLVSLGCSNEQCLALSNKTFPYHNCLLIKLSWSLEFNDPNLTIKKEKDNSFHQVVFLGLQRPVNLNELHHFE